MENTPLPFPFIPSIQSGQLEKEFHALRTKLANERKVPSSLPLGSGELCLFPRQKSNFVENQNNYRSALSAGEFDATA